MDIPRHWARQEGEARGPDGRRRPLMAWGWSAVSRGEAADLARQRLAGLVARVQQGLGLPRGYAYGSRPVREEIVDEIRGADGATAVLTRNGYGSLVLNAARALFLDVDLPEPGPVSTVARWLGRRAGDGETAVLGRLREALGRESRASFRIYRTAAGFRVLAIDPEFTPGSPESERLMEAAGADRAFAALCRTQRSFRARLTPKPWRCGLPAPPGSHPRESPDVRRRFDAWLAGYEAACRTRATCRFVEAVGSGWPHREIGRILDVHDEITRAGEPLPLA
jgi:hypothetical protein